MTDLLLAQITIKQSECISMEKNRNKQKSETLRVQLGMPGVGHSREHTTLFESKLIFE